MGRRLGLFIDYQNVYRGARRAFSFDSGPHWLGQVNPRALAELIAARQPDTTVETVRVYRGMPDGHRDPKGYAASSKQVDAWRQLPRVEVVTRPLRYPFGYPAEKPMEKGIDVQIALDFVLGATDGDFNVGVLFSADTDLRPAVELVLARTKTHVEVAGWQSSATKKVHRLSIPSRKLWCHFLTLADYKTVADPTNYTP